MLLHGICYFGSHNILPFRHLAHTLATCSLSYLALLLCNFEHRRPIVCYIQFGALITSEGKPRVYARVQHTTIAHGPYNAPHNQSIDSHWSCVVTSRTTAYPRLNQGMIIHPTTVHPSAQITHLDKGHEAVPKLLNPCRKAL